MLLSMSTRLNALDDQVYWSEPCAELDRPIIGLVRGSSSTLMFDACASHAHAMELKLAMGAGGLAAPGYAVISHSHSDHWFGLADFDLVALSSAKCRGHIGRMMGLDWRKEAFHGRVEAGKENPLLEGILDEEYGADRGQIELKGPRLGLEGSLEIDLGGLHAVVTELGSSHCDDSLVLHLVEKKLLFLGDILYVRGYDRREIEGLLERISAFGAELYVDSHADRPLGQAEMEEHLVGYAKSL